MIIKTTEMYRIWVLSGSQATNNYKSSDLLVIPQAGEADRLLGLLKAGWDQITTNGYANQAAVAVKDAGYATGCDDRSTPHQRGQQRTARENIKQYLGNGATDETAFMIFRLFVELGADGVMASGRNCGVAAVPLLTYDQLEVAAASPQP